MEEHREFTKTIFIARVLSLYLLITGLGFLFSSGFYSKMIAVEGSDPVLINLYGMVHFFIGASILTAHYCWKTTLQKIVTVLGVMFFLKGSFLIVTPVLILKAGNNTAQNPQLMSAVFILAGAVIGYMSYFRRKFNA